MKLLLPLLLAVVITGCSVSEYYQVYSLQSSQGDNMEFVDDSLIISYNLWGENGQMGFTLFNHSDSLLYIDFKKSFFIINGVAYDYFTNSSITFQNAAGYTNGTRYKWNTSNWYDFYSSFSESASKAMTYYEKDILIVPAHSYKTISRFALNDYYLANCDLVKYPAYNNPKSIKFTLANTPLKYINTLTIRLGESGEFKTYAHAFYVHEVGNMHPQDFRVMKDKIVCGKPTEDIEYSYPFAKSNRFYLRYAP